VFDRPPVNAFDCAGWAAIAAELEALGATRARHRRPRRGPGLLRRRGHQGTGGRRQPDRRRERGNYATFKAIHRNPKPVIVAVHGFVLGGGIGICGAADIVMASECASFGLPEVDRGAMGGGAHCSACSRCRRCATCSPASPSTPTRPRLGAIERVVPRDQLRDAPAVARKIAAKSPAMIRIAKEALTGIEDGNLEDKYRWEQGFTCKPI
jgi:enoyl-CoA hydratase